MLGSLALWLLTRLNVLALVLADVAPTPTATPRPSSSALPPLLPTDMVRSLTLGAVAFLFGLLVGKPVINWLRDRRIGKQIRIEGPESHQIKTGTPTMGGLIFLIPLVIVIGIFTDIPRFNSLLLPLGIVISCGILGGFDDLLSTVGRNRGGLTARFKMAWLIAIATITALILYLPKPWGLDHHWLILPFYRDPNNPINGGIDIGIWFVPIAVIAVAGMANAINFTDGLDTLAGGTSAIAFACYGVIAFLQGQEP